MAFTLDKTTVFEDLEGFLAESVGPRANQLDSDRTALFDAFEQLGDRNWLTPKMPESLGGQNLTAQAYQGFQATLAQYSGALAFLQTQHQSAASLLLTSENDALKAAYLPGMATGIHRIGVGFSQLRRRPAPLVATEVATGYRLTGEVPWVTGAGLFSHFVGAAVLLDGRSVFGLLPLTSRQVDAGRLEVSEPMALAGMAATSTVQVTLVDWLLRSDEVVGLREAGWLEGRDRANPLSPIGLILGCAQAGIAVLEQALIRRQIDHSAAQQLKVKLAWLRMDVPRVMGLPVEAYDQKMALRGRAIALMNTCAQAAVIASSGAANVMSHPAQRIYKESLVFSVSGQTTAGVIATLNALL